MGRTTRPPEGPFQQQPLRPSGRPSKALTVLHATEARLRGAIARDAAHHVQLAAAERVRRARLGLAKARAWLAELPSTPTDDTAAQLAGEAEAARVRWATLSAEEILAHYRR